MKGSTVHIPRILLFCLIAIVVSNVFRFDVYGIRSGLQLLPSWLYVVTCALLEGSGVLIAALIALKWMRREQAIDASLLGLAAKKSLWIPLVPLAMLVVMGVRNEFGLNTHVYGLIAGLSSFAYCIMEETGWRGYLQQELKSIRPLMRYVIIGSIWYLWHLSFLSEASLQENLMFLFMLILGSWGLGQVITTTRSIVITASFHLLIQLMMFNALIKDGLSGKYKLIILAVSILVWMMMFKKGKAPKSTLVNEQP
jgi:membrane protease YdiL (CAAX protease family)